MKVSKAVTYCLEYHWTNSKKNSIRPYEFVLSRFGRAVLKIKGQHLQISWLSILGCK